MARRKITRGMEQGWKIEPGTPVFRAWAGETRPATKRSANMAPKLAVKVA